MHVFRESVFLTQQKVLCEIQDIFPWQTIWDLSKKISPPANSQLLRRNMKIRKSHLSMYISRIMSCIGGILHYFRVSVFLIQQKVLCEIQDIFLWQTTEICQKKFHLRQTQSSWEETWKSENLTILCISLTLCLILVVFCMILEYLCFWPSRRCSAGSKIFFCDKQQRFVKKIFTSGKLRALEKKHENPKISQFCVYLSHYVLYWWYIVWF